MAKITHIKPSDLLQGKGQQAIFFDGTVGEWLAENIIPGTAFSVYEGEPCLDNDITFDSDGNPNIDYLANANGDFYVIETPSGTLTAQIIIGVVLAVAVIALTPKPELPTNVSRSQESPNNALSGRSNRARPLQRIPDIRGSVHAIPDIIAPTYSTYEQRREIEHGFYCVGRKQLLIEDLKDGNTPIDLIENSSAGIYYPLNSPNLGPPDVSINNHVSETIFAAYRTNQVNGITLSADFASSIIQAIDTQVAAPSALSTQLEINVLGFTYDDAYVIGENVILENFIVNAVDLSGTYEIIDIENGEIFGTPFGAMLIELGFVYGDTDFKVPTSGTMKAENASEYLGWFYNTETEFEQVLINIVAPNGMYRDTGAVDLQSRTVEFEIQIEGVDIDGNPDGNVVTLNEELTGNSQDLIGKSIRYDFSYPKRFRSRLKRTTARFVGAAVVVDEIKVDDLYGMKFIDQDDFGDVTTIQTRTVATPFATAVKERQLNCQATELLDEYLGSGVFAGFLSPNTRAVQSFITDAIDPVIGNRALSDIDADTILALDSEITTYFSSSKQGEFAYTFDSTNITFQEHTQTIFNAINCIAFRESGKISALFEKPQTIPSLLFTHRSKQPDSETHTRNTNPSLINDGVEFNYIDQDTNTTETIYLPTDKSAVNPKKFDIPGIQNKNQAIIRAYREFNKILNSKITLDVTVTAEGRYIRPNDMISVVKGTRVQTFDGEIIGQSGLTLTLSADVSFVAGDHYIVLKKTDGSVESILVTAGPESNQVILDSAPSEAIRTDGIRRTEFSFGPEAKQYAELWLAQEIDISDKWFVNLKAINYSDEYYKDDLQSLRAFSNGFSNGFD